MLGAREVRPQHKVVHDRADEERRSRGANVDVLDVRRLIRVRIGELNHGHGMREYARVGRIPVAVRVAPEIHVDRLPDWKQRVQNLDRRDAFGTFCNRVLHEPRHVWRVARHIHLCGAIVAAIRLRKI